MLTGVVFDIKEFAVHDGPGLRVTVSGKDGRTHQELGNAQRVVDSLKELHRN